MRLIKLIGLDEHKKIMQVTVWIFNNFLWLGDRTISLSFLTNSLLKTGPSQPLPPVLRAELSRG